LLKIFLQTARKPQVLQLFPALAIKASRKIRIFDGQTKVLFEQR